MRRQSGSGARAPMKHPQGEVLVFLDVDGVLNMTNSTESRQKLDAGCLAELKAVRPPPFACGGTLSLNLKIAVPRAQVMDGVPGSKIILSSAWRLVATMTVLLSRILESAGIKPPVGATGVIGAGRIGVGGYGGRAISFDKQITQLCEQRAAEILQAVKERRPAAWCAIDDLDLSCKLDDAHFVRTDDARGFTSEDRGRAVDRLLAQIAARDAKRAADAPPTDASAARAPPVTAT